MVAAALILLFTGPWLVYLVVPVPDQLAEYRNYSMCAAFALLAAQLPFWPWGFWLLIYFIGRTHVHAMPFADAVAFWKRAKATASGDTSRATQEIGAFLKIGGKPVESEPYFKEAIRLNPGLAPAMENLASLYMTSGREEEGFRLLLELTGRCPRYASGWQFLGLVYEKRTNTTGARLAFEEALRLERHLPLSANHLGLIAFKEGRYPEALDAFQRAQITTPSEAAYQYNEALTLYALGRKDDADAIKKRYDGMQILWNPEMIPPPREPQPEYQHA